MSSTILPRDQSPSPLPAVPAPAAAPEPAVIAPLPTDAYMPAAGARPSGGGAGAPPLTQAPVNTTFQALVSDLATGLSAVFGAVVSFIKKLFTPAAAASAAAPASTSAPAGNVGQWISQAFAVLEASGVPASQLDANDVATIIQHESGGNPDAVNNWDSNAKAGTPSEGLMQTIGPTFQAHALPGHTDILNPVDNIIAGVRYALARYGSLSNVPGIKSLAHGGPYVGY